MPVGDTCGSLAPEFQAACEDRRKAAEREIVGNTCGSLAPEFQEQCKQDKKEKADAFHSFGGNCNSVAPEFRAACEAKKAAELKIDGDTCNSLPPEFQAVCEQEKKCDPKMQEVTNDLKVLEEQEESLKKQLKTLMQNQRDNIAYLSMIHSVSMIIYVDKNKQRDLSPGICKPGSTQKDNLHTKIENIYQRQVGIKNLNSKIASLGLTPDQLVIVLNKNKAKISAIYMILGFSMPDESLKLNLDIGKIKAAITIEPNGKKIRDLLSMILEGNFC